MLEQNLPSKILQNCLYKFCKVGQVELLNSFWRLSSNRESFFSNRISLVFLIVWLELLLKLVLIECRPYYGHGMEREKSRVRGWWSEKDKAEHYVYRPITNKDLFLLFFLIFLLIYYNCIKKAYYQLSIWIFTLNFYEFDHFLKNKVVINTLVLKKIFILWNK